MNIQNNLPETGRTSTYAVKLLSALAGPGKGIDYLLGLGEEMLGNPIVITDKSWKAVAMSASVDIPDDAHWNELRTSGCLSASTVISGIRDNLADRLERSYEPFMWHGRDTKYARLMNKVPVNGKLAATVSVIEYLRPFKDGDEELLALFCNAVATELQKSELHRFTRGIMYEEFIASLLDGKLRDPGMVEERIKLLNIGIKKNSYVFVFDITGYDPGQFSVTYMRDVLEKMISGGQALIYDGKIVITASFTRARDILKTELYKLGEFLKQHNIRCGISRRCERLHELRQYYEQAIDAQRVGTYVNFDKYIYPYGEYAVYHIAELYGNSGKSQTLLHPALLTLMDYDAEYGTSFTRSLYAYLSSFHVISRSAAALGLHRNTFVYHLRRIREIMDLDLDDYKTVLLLELSFLTLEYEKKFSLE